MANTITDLLVTIMARGLPALRKAAVMPRLVRTDFSTELASKGKTVDFPLPQTQAVSDVSPSATPLTPGNVTADTVQLTLDKWKHTSFHLTDQELTQIEARANFLPMQMEMAFKALGEQLNSDLMALYKDIYGYVGTAGTTPFASTVAAATDARKTLNKQLAPLDPRFGVLDPDAMANALNLAGFSSFQQSSDPNVIINGMLGRKYGFDWAEDQQVPSHTKGAAGTVLVDQADVEVGDTTVHFDGLTTKASAGDVFTVAGDTQTYVVVSASDLTSTDGDMTFYPPAVVAWANDAAVTFKATHVANLAFHRDAFALAIRPLADSVSQLLPGVVQQVMTDPLTGIPVRVEVIRQNKQTVFDLDILYGVKTLRPELACRIAG